MKKFFYRVGAALLSLCALMGLVVLGLPGCDGGGGSGLHLFAVESLIGEPSQDYNLTILHMNDIHAQLLPLGTIKELYETTNPHHQEVGGLARIATLARLIRARNAARGKATLFLNAGDLFDGTLFFDYDNGATIWRALEAAGVEVTQIGNHDHIYGVNTLYNSLDYAFPGTQGQPATMRILFGNVNPDTLSTTGTGDIYPVGPNVKGAFENCFSDEAGTIDATGLARMDAPTANSFLFNQTLMYERDGIRIGIFGVDTEEIIYRLIPGNLSTFVKTFLTPEGKTENLTFYEPVVKENGKPPVAPYASSMIAYLEDPNGDGNPADGADLIIAVTHLGHTLDVELAETAEATATGRRIDLVVGGHSHTRLNTAVPVAHPAGKKSWVVQADDRGKFLGRLDFKVDPLTNTVKLVQSRLLPIDGRIPDDPEVMAVINAAKEGLRNRPTYDHPFKKAVASVAASVVGQQGCQSAIGRIAANSIVWRTSQPGSHVNPPIDFAAGIDNTIRAGLPKGQLTPAQVNEVLPIHYVRREIKPNTIHFVDLPAGPVSFLGTTYVHRVELLLELLYGLDSLVAIIQSVAPDLQIMVPEHLRGNLYNLYYNPVSELGMAGALDSFHWSSSISFVVDRSRSGFQRIEPSSIIIGGKPLNSNQSYRFGLNSLLATYLGIVRGLKLDDGQPIFLYDPNSGAYDTGIDEWRALKDYLEAKGIVGPDMASLRSGGMITAGPDLTLNRADIRLEPARPTAGQKVRIRAHVLNLGRTAATSGRLEAYVDPTPWDLADNRDGVTDSITGYGRRFLGSTRIGSVSPSSAGGPGYKEVTLEFYVPLSFARWTYLIELEIKDVQSADPARPESILTNNEGPALTIPMQVR
jgi:2',3'-cyclic-nucleotide 2'-phosphodiesterase (5'-nucleotidase family)